MQCSGIVSRVKQCVQTFESVGEILKCNHSNQRTALSCDTVYYSVPNVVQVFESVDERLEWPLK